MSGEEFVVVGVEEAQERERLMVESWASAETPQVPTFTVGSESISVPPQDARRLIRALVNSGSSDSVRAARRIERAMRLYSGTTVRLSIGEDEAVVHALATLREQSSGFGQNLERLERALRRHTQPE